MPTKEKQCSPVFYQLKNGGNIERAYHAAKEPFVAKIDAC
jgi:hypothetical protein